MPCHRARTPSWAQLVSFTGWLVLHISMQYSSTAVPLSLRDSRWKAAKSSFSFSIAVWEAACNEHTNSFYLQVVCLCIMTWNSVIAASVESLTLGHNEVLKSFVPRLCRAAPGSDLLLMFSAQTMDLTRTSCYTVNPPFHSKISLPVYNTIILEDIHRCEWSCWSWNTSLHFCLCRVYNTKQDNQEIQLPAYFKSPDFKSKNAFIL